MGMPRGAPLSSTFYTVFACARVATDHLPRVAWTICAHSGNPNRQLRSGSPQSSFRERGDMMDATARAASTAERCAAVHRAGGKASGAPPQHEPRHPDDARPRCDFR
eukprot:3229197-Prymnesium_polylepis.2